MNVLLLTLCVKRCPKPLPKSNAAGLATGADFHAVRQRRTGIRILFQKRGHIGSGELDEFHKRQVRVAGATPN